MTRQSPPRRNERGIALLLALLVLAVLIILIAQMSVTSLSHKTVSENYLNDLQNGYGARAGYYRARLYLEAEVERNPPVDDLGRRWATPFVFPLGRSTVRVSIEDSERRVNLSMLNGDDGKPNVAAANRLRRLCAALGHPRDVAERIVDYIDADTKGEYESGARNARLYNVEELLRIDGLPREALYGGEWGGRKVAALLDFVTLWPKGAAEGGQAGAVNANTAPVEVLLALSDHMSPTIAQAIVSYRAGRKGDGSLQSFETVDDLKKVGGMTDEVFNDLKTQVLVKSSHFEIRVRSSVGNVSKSWLYVVRRGAPKTTGAPATGGESQPSASSQIALVASQKTNDFLSVAPGEEK